MSSGPTSSEQALTLPAPPLSAAERLANLLAAEAEAARAADVDALLGIQAEKALLLDVLEKSPPPAPEMQELIASATVNLPILRQLVALHRGLLGAHAPLYGPDGLQDASPVAGRIAGTL